MVNFPVFERLEANGFGLYPGDGTKDGVTVQFKPGLTLVLGSNGLGKTTLITIMFRLLTGPFDIPALMSRPDLGNASLKVAGISKHNKTTFAHRVSDGARGALGKLTFKVGENEIIVQRRLSDLSLTGFSVNGSDKTPDDQNVFQPTISAMVGVWSFGDWILLLRHMIFYFEDRRELVWDSSAQRQLLRTLLLPPAAAQSWTEAERSILELDSRMRNLRFAAYREEQALTRVESKVKSSAEVREELRALEALQAPDVGRREQLDSNFVELDDSFRRAQLRLLRAQQERETRYREYERAKLYAIEARFPEKSDTARYILEQLFAEADCLTCGSHAPLASVVLNRRIDANECIVCGSELPDSASPIPTEELSERRVQRTRRLLDEIEAEVQAAEADYRDAERDSETARLELAELNAKVSARTARIDLLIQLLPPDQQEVHKQRTELASMRSRVDALAAELGRKRIDFAQFIDSQNRAMAQQSATIMAAFVEFAEGFLLETTTLVWAPQRARVGQTGELIEFPAFAIDMTGSDFTTAVRRAGPEQVSESQREFIDLAFRMALMKVASNQGNSSLIIDAPESSLDGIFVKRAANVLARYAHTGRANRLVITSNLVDGDLIPELLKSSAESGDRLGRIIDLFRIAEPTAAVRELGPEYIALMDRLIAKAEPLNPPANSKEGPPPSRKRRR